MANNYFQFKQFSVQQDRCAMKVCTDACIFGPFVAQHINSNKLVANAMLDIGTGTGLLSLMLAQKTNGTIDGVELDEAASQQARHNFEQSPWNKRLNIFNADALQFYPGKKYDCIISNPPFFEGGLRSGDKKKNATKHDTALTLQQLLHVTGRLLSPHGFFAVLLPAHRVGFFTKIAIAANYYLNEQLMIQHTRGHPFSRGILFFTHHKTAVASNELVIEDSGGKYTPEFTGLLKDYYLNL